MKKEIYKLREKLMPDYCAYPPKIIMMRSEGKEFFAINDQIGKEKERMEARGERGDVAKRGLARGKKEIE